MGSEPGLRSVARRNGGMAAILLALVSSGHGHRTCLVRVRPECRVHYNIRPSVVDDCIQLGLLLTGHLELIQRLLKIIQE
jgi:hypothetical protein